MPAGLSSRALLQVIMSRLNGPEPRLNHDVFYTKQYSMQGIRFFVGFLFCFVFKQTILFTDDNLIMW